MKNIRGKHMVNTYITHNETITIITLNTVAVLDGRRLLGHHFKELLTILLTGVIVT